MGMPQDPAGQLKMIEETIKMASHMRPGAIRAAATLGVADLVGPEPVSSDSLADELEVNASALRILLRYLSTLEFFERHEGDTYSITERGRLLRRDGTPSLHEMFDNGSVLGRSEVGFVDLVDTVKSRTPSHVSSVGKGFWREIQHDEKYVESLGRLLGTEPSWDAEIVLEAPRWASTERVIDVGGGQGAMVLALLEAHPHLSGIVLDLPNSVTLARRSIADRDLEDRCRADTVDMLHSVPTFEGTYLMSAVLADWFDAEAVRILSNVRAAMPTGSTLLVSEVTLPRRSDESWDAASAEADMMVEATVSSPDRGLEDIVEMGKRAGLEHVWTGRNTDVRSIVEFRAAG